MDMERFFKHYYEHICSYDYEMLEMLEKGKSVLDENTGKYIVVLNTDLFRQEGDFIISKLDDRLRMCLSLEETIQIPSGVRSIGYDVFNERNCPNVKHIIFPESVEGICPYAVMSDTVEEITLNNKYIYISDEAFEHSYSLRLIHHMPERCIIHVRPHGNQGPQTVKIVPMDLPKSKEDNPEDNDLPF